MEKWTKTAAPARLFDVAHSHKTIAVRPLFGRERLVRIERRKQNGVLFCSSIMSISDIFTIADSNRRTERFGAKYQAAPPAFLGEPRLNVPNEASAEEMRQFHDYGRSFVHSFTPQRGKTYSFQCDIYRPVEIIFGGAVFDLDFARFARYVLTLDLSAYLSAGYQIESPRCELEAIASSNKRAAKGPPRIRRLIAKERGPGLWDWSANNLSDAILRLAWRIYDRDPAHAFNGANLERLSTELSVDPHVAKDLYNFVSVCHYLAADFQSLHEIERKMIVTRSALTRSLESIEKLVGAELIERTKGKGLIRITPAGEAVLEWWSQFYMRWTPIIRET